MDFKDTLQKLTAVESEFDYFEDGKSCTIRKGRRSLKLGLLTFESLKEKRQEVVFITHIIHCTVKNIPMEYIKKDGFTDRHDMVAQMQEFYPDIDEDTEVTVIIFNSRF